MNPIFSASGKFADQIKCFNSKLTLYNLIKVAQDALSGYMIRFLQTNVCNFRFSELIGVTRLDEWVWDTCKILALVGLNLSLLQTWFQFKREPFKHTTLQLGGAAWGMLSHHLGAQALDHWEEETRSLFPGWRGLDLLESRGRSGCS